MLLCYNIMFVLWCVYSDICYAYNKIMFFFACLIYLCFICHFLLHLWCLRVPCRNCMHVFVTQELVKEEARQYDWLRRYCVHPPIIYWDVLFGNPKSGPKDIFLAGVCCVGENFKLKRTQKCTLCRSS